MAYGSARDLPTFIELSRQLDFLRGARFLIPRDKRPDVERMAAELDRFVDVVDGFYSTLGPRNWIFHESLSFDAVGEWLKGNASPEAVEEKLIQVYGDEDKLWVMVQLASRHPAMRKRDGLLRHAISDHLAGRYYAVVQVLLSVMDGFVNEYETIRRGLHAREAEDLDVSDAFISHHLGLAHAHATFRKVRGVSTEEPVFELYRNGIVHGTVINYDNAIVASKAWNRLFAVADWAAAREKEKQPPKDQPGFREVFGGLIEHAKQKAEASKWMPILLVAGEEGFAEHGVYGVCDRFLSAWQRGNYKEISAAIDVDKQAKLGKRLISEMKRRYVDYPLEVYEIVSISQNMATGCTVKALLRQAGNKIVVDLRWINQDEEKGGVKPSTLGGVWRLAIWDPQVLIARGETVEG
ncbi:hypothetical protein ACIQMJ_29260 [Actinosynnema sp. NPDC091369]